MGVPVIVDAAAQGVEIVSLGNVALSIFLVMALMTLRLWELAGLVVPLIIVLVAQVLFIAFACLLVIPRLIATVVMMPLLAFWAMLMSLLGGGIFVWLVLGIPPLTYIQRLQEVVPLTDLWIGLIKAPVFGFIIGLAGCFQGMLVQDHQDLQGQFVREVGGWVRSGELKYNETFAHGIESGAEAFLGMLRGENTGKMIVSLDA